LQNIFGVGKKNFIKAMQIFKTFQKSFYWKGFIENKEAVQPMVETLERFQNNILEESLTKEKVKAFVDYNFN